MKKIIHTIQKKVFPFWLNLILGTYYRILKNYVDYTRRKKNKIEYNGKGLKISFAGVLPDDPGAVIHGGRIKLLELKNNFIINENNYNLLYLVSSALPKYVISIVKWAKKNNIKIVWNQNGVAYKAWCGIFYKTANIINKKLIHMADYVIYQSNFCKESSDKFLGVYKGNWKIIYNPVDIKKFYFIKKSYKEKPLKLLICGSHRAFYRIKLALLTLYEINKVDDDVRLLIAGRLDWKNAIKETDSLIEELKLKEKVDFFGPYKNDTAVDVYNKAHILIHTQYNDNCPTVVLEAMACGLPVVATNSGGTPELIGKEAGICVDVCKSYIKRYEPNPVELCGAVIKVKNNLSKYSKNAVLRVKKYFSSVDWIKKHKEIFDEVLK